MANCTILTETGIDNFKIFVKFLAEHLKANGHENIRVSIEVVKELQQFIKQEFETRGENNKAANMVIMSAHNNC